MIALERVNMITSSEAGAAGDMSWVKTVARVGKQERATFKCICPQRPFWVFHLELASSRINSLSLA